MTNWENMSAMADGQLSAAEAEDLQAAMEANPNLKAQYQSILNLKQTLSSRLPSHDSPETLSLCLDRIRELSSADKTESVVHRFRYAFASVLAIAIFSAALVNRLEGGDILDRGGIARSLSANVAGSGDAVVPEGPASTWLRQQLSSDSPSYGVLQLVRAERILTDGQTIGRFTYTDGASEFLCLVVPGVVDCSGSEVPGYPGLKQTTINGLNALTWCENGMSFVFASHQPVGDMLAYIRDR